MLLETPQRRRRIQMRSRHIVAGAAAIAALAGGSAAAVAATADDKKATENAVLADAAKKLGVGTDDLRSALSDAENAQLDAEVKAGQLTQAQADAIKARRSADGTVLDVGGRGGPGDHGGHGGARLLDDAAKALGVTTSSLADQLRGGKTLEDVAKAKGKSLDDVKSAVKASATAELKADLDAKRITQAQYDDQISRLDDEIADLASGKLGGHGFGRGGHGAPDGASTTTPPATTTTTTTP
jgi:hypothetical protein